MAQARLVSFLAESNFLIEQISWARSSPSPNTAAFASSSARLYLSRVWVHTGSSGKDVGPEIHSHAHVATERIEPHQSLPAQSGAGSRRRNGSLKTGRDCTSFPL